MEQIGQNKFEKKENLKRVIINLKDSREDEELLQDLLLKANQKEFGKEVTAQDIFSMGLRIFNEKHIEKLKENSLSISQRIERDWILAKKNENYNGSLEEFIWDNYKQNKGVKHV